MMKLFDILNNEWNGDCLGCSLANKEIFSLGGIIKETENFILAQDFEVPIKGFLIVGSKNHIKSISEMTQEQARELMDLCYFARKALMSIEDILECTLIQEERSKHFHVWILPKYEWMKEQFDASLTSVRAIMDFARKNMKTQNNIDKIIDTVNSLRIKMNN